MVFMHPLNCRSIHGKVVPGKGASRSSQDLCEPVSHQKYPVDWFAFRVLHTLNWLIEDCELAHTQQNTYPKHHQTVLPRGWENGIYAMCSCVPQEGHRDFLPQFCGGWWLHVAPLGVKLLAGRLNAKILG